MLPLSPLHAETCKPVLEPSDSVLGERSMGRTFSSTCDGSDSERGSVRSSDSVVAECEGPLSSCAEDHHVGHRDSASLYHGNCVTVRNTFVHFPSCSPLPAAGSQRKAQSLPATPLFHGSFAEQLLQAELDHDSDMSHDASSATSACDFCEGSLPTTPWLQDAGDFGRLLVNSTGSVKHPGTLASVKVDESQESCDKASLDSIFQLGDASNGPVFTVKNTFIDGMSPSFEKLGDVPARAQSLPTTPFWPKASAFGSQIEAALEHDEESERLTLNSPREADTSAWHAAEQVSSPDMRNDGDALAALAGKDLPTIRFGTVDWPSIEP